MNQFQSLGPDRGIWFPVGDALGWGEEQVWDGVSWSSLITALLKIAGREGGGTLGGPPSSFQEPDFFQDLVSVDTTSPAGLVFNWEQVLGVQLLQGGGVPPGRPVGW